MPLNKGSYNVVKRCLFSNVLIHTPQHVYHKKRTFKSLAAVGIGWFKLFRVFLCLSWLYSTR